MIAMELVRPTLAHLEGYRAALERGWSSDNIRREAATREDLAGFRWQPGTSELPTHVLGHIGYART